jgi:hypoxanthine phosphoribosyltransferase
MLDYREFISKILITEKKLKKRIAEIGSAISRDYKNSKHLLLVCILRGGVMFLSDLIRKITIPHSLEFMAVSSYGTGNRESTGNIRITLDLISDIANMDVLIVEDIIDSGRTIASVVEMLSTREPHSIQVCTLLDKSERREVPVNVKYVGFSIPNMFVFGYGLDLDEYYRNLPFIGVVDLIKYKTIAHR